MIKVTSDITIDDAEVSTHFVRSSGPGGQNVNKVATAVCLRFDVSRSGSLPEDVRSRLIRLAGSRMTKSGQLIIQADRYRSLKQNRRDAMDRLITMIRAAARPARHRRRTKPSRAVIQRRLDAKKRRGRRKTDRRRVMQGDH